MVLSWMMTQSVSPLGRYRAARAQNFSSSLLFSILPPHLKSNFVKWSSRPRTKSNLPSHVALPQIKKKQQKGTISFTEIFFGKLCITKTYVLPPLIIVALLVFSHHCSLMMRSLVHFQVENYFWLMVFTIIIMTESFKFNIWKRLVAFWFHHCTNRNVQLFYHYHHSSDKVMDSDEGFGSSWKGSERIESTRNVK